MKKYILTCLMVLLSVVAFAEEPPMPSETGRPGGVGGVGFGEVEPDVPIEMYIPVLLVVAICLVFFYSRKMTISAKK
ncbi:hypothetical protein SAMN05443429_11162 [Cruoricaptor ignavus]|uniref:Signal peptidase n=1 Tax=Cruoricaptor ignavus TaxID=1118202 RepID=A0A1M6H7S0_9FLAO|nr:hypothetical protein [Cruoricaptor ignavus]SHJ18255.1 hypothetical protein SAMN05443429_11162 [Cruoricaptor ignavus]